jgi:hypothetical protein
MNAVSIATLVAAAPIGLFLVGLFAYLLLFLPFSLLQARLLPPEGRTTVDGVTTLEEAVARCRATGLTGRALVAYAQGLVARKMSYSRRNPWDTWSRCFERGMGYCVQQAMALRLLLRALGFDAEPVQALRCRFPAHRVHGVLSGPGVSGHMWLRVPVDGQSLDVCPGNPANEPGRVTFEVLSPVRRVPTWIVPVLHLLSAAENVRRDWPQMWAGLGTGAAPEAGDCHE